MVYLRPVGHKSDALFTTLPSHLLCCIAVKGVTQLHDVVYIITAGSKAILRFNATSHQRLSDIHMRDMREPVDIVACEQTSQFYVAMWSVTCVWRVSADGADIRRWLAESWGSPLNPTSLSMTPQPVFWWWLATLINWYRRRWTPTCSTAGLSMARRRVTDCDVYRQSQKHRIDSTGAVSDQWSQRRWWISASVQRFTCLTSGPESSHRHWLSR